MNLDYWQIKLLCQDHSAQFHIPLIHQTALFIYPPTWHLPMIRPVPGSFFCVETERLGNKLMQHTTVTFRPRSALVKAPIWCLPLLPRTLDGLCTVDIPVSSQLNMRLGGKYPCLPVQVVKFKKLVHCGKPMAVAIEVGSGFLKDIQMQFIQCAFLCSVSPSGDSVGRTWSHCSDVVIYVACVWVGVTELSLKHSHTLDFFVLRFFGRYPAMGVDPLLPECHGTSSGSWMERWIICGVLHGRNH